MTKHKDTKEKAALAPLDVIDIVLSMYNQEKLIERVLYGIFKNTTTPFNLILVFDGCTDRTKPRALSYIEKHKPVNLTKLITADAPNVFETKANNIGFKLGREEYILTLQDDMVIQELGWERRLTFPIRRYPNVFAVTARGAQDIDEMSEEKQVYKNRKALELGTLDRRTFAIRDVINRGPVALRRSALEKLEYLNESYAPSDLDDADLCLRAWKQFGWKCGVFSIDYISRVEWGKTRADDSTMYEHNPISRNQARIGTDHADYILNGEKHDEDILIDETQIDYINNKNLGTHTPLIYPARFDTKDLKRITKKYMSQAKIRGVIRKSLVSILRFLNTLPVFNQLFYWIHDIRKKEFKPKRFMATMTSDDFLLGTVNSYEEKLWKSIALYDFEPVETTIVKRILPFVDSFVDIGAHIGYYTCLVGTHAQIPIHAFEPNPRNYASLIKNVEINRIQNAHTYDTGLGKNTGETTLYGTDADGSIVPQTFNIVPKEKTTVKIATLDSYTNSITGNSVCIKIDVEGNELAVLEGGLNFLKTHKPIFLLMEIVKHWGGGENKNFESTFHLLKELDYTAFVIPKIIEPMVEVKDLGHLTAGGYFMVKNEKIPFVRKHIKDLLENL